MIRKEAATPGSNVAQTRVYEAPASTCHSRSARPARYTCPHCFSYTYCRASNLRHKHPPVNLTQDTADVHTHTLSLTHRPRKPGWDAPAALPAAAALPLPCHCTCPAMRSCSALDHTAAAVNPQSCPPFHAGRCRAAAAENRPPAPSPLRRPRCPCRNTHSRHTPSPCPSQGP